MIDAKSKPQDRAAILSSIASALRGDLPLKDFDPLIERAGRAMNEARGFASELRQWALDPALGQDEVASARAAADTAEFDAKRMAGAFAQLEEKASIFRDAEMRAAHRRAHAATAKRTKECAARIRRDFPEISKLLLPMIKEIIEVGFEVDEANANLPPGAQPLNRPEGIARAFFDQGNDNTLLSQELVRISQMCVPVLDDPKGVAWPAGYVGHRDGPLTKPFHWVTNRYREMIDRKSYDQEPHYPEPHDQE